MSKPAATSAEKPVTVVFPRTGNAWIDAGTVGLHRILHRLPSYLEPIPAEMKAEAPGSTAFPDVAAELRPDGLEVTGPQDEVQRCLERAYDCLISCHYSVSSKRQEEATKTHNFYLDPETEQFKPFPKKRAAGAALLMFDKAARPVGDQENWGVDPATGKKSVGRLPERYAHLQPKLDTLLSATGMKAGPPAGLLVGGENAVRPKVKIAVGGRCKDEPDFLTGEPAAGPQPAKQTAFPLFGGSRAFTSGADTDPRLGWRTDFVGKFAPVVCFHYVQGDDLFLFLPTSADLTRTADLADRLNRITAERDPNHYRNFELRLGGYFGGRAELTLAFLHRAFVELSRESRGGEVDMSLPETDDADRDEAEDDDPIHPAAVAAAVGTGAAVNFTVVAARKSGNVWAGREFAEFSDTLYVARLLGRMTTVVDKLGRASQRACDPKRLMQCLVDHSSEKHRTVLRDAVCGRILRKQPVLDLLERHAYRLFGDWLPGAPLHLRPLLDFAVLYQPALHESDPIMKAAYDEMVKQAQWLGRNIADGVAGAGKDTDRNESPGRSKGAFFRLRRVRKPADFLAELGRLQMRYQIDVPAKALDADVFNPDTFAEYRGFCAIAALSRFQYLAGKKGEKPAS